MGLEDWKGLLSRFGSKLPSGFIRYVSESNGDLALAAEKMSNEEHRAKLANNLIFINWEKDGIDSISKTHLNFSESKSIPITEIKTDDFSKIFFSFTR